MSKNFMYERSDQLFKNILTDSAEIEEIDDVLFGIGDQECEVIEFCPNNLTS